MAIKSSWCNFQLAIYSHLAYSHTSPRIASIAYALTFHVLSKVLSHEFLTVSRISTKSLCYIKVRVFAIWPGCFCIAYAKLLIKQPCDTWLVATTQPLFLYVTVMCASSECLHRLCDNVFVACASSSLCISFALHRV